MINRFLLCEETYILERKGRCFKSQSETLRADLFIVYEEK